MVIRRDSLSGALRIVERWKSLNLVRAFGVLLLPLLWLFRRALFYGEMFSFRDSSHYYHPLYKYVMQRWMEGVPLWNPFDNLGQPLLADPTAAVVYPGKLLFVLPVSYECCCAIYVVAHLWLAGCGLYCCARSTGVSKSGALLGALAYELSGHVLFQYCNPIFCVGAAWLPWAILHFERMLRNVASWQSRKRHGILLAMSLSMMVYGGDPQLAYHFVLIAMVRLAFCDNQKERWRGAWSLCWVCLLALGLSALQVLPSLEWARQTNRIASVGETFGEATVSSLSDHRQKIYDFSIGPWRWCELVLPNVTGSLFPVNARWISLLPGEGRFWVPSLYMGLLPFCLALRRSRLRKGSRFGRWLTWITILGMLAALGKFGLGWIGNELSYLFAPEEYESSQLPSGVGGLYWLLTRIAPGYASFRYPAKWWTIVAFGLAMLSAKGLSALRRNPSRMWMWWSIAVGATSVGTVALAFGVIQSYTDSTNAIFGPFESRAAWATVGYALVHALVVLASVVTMLRSNRYTRCWAWLLVLLDLVIAQSALVTTLPGSAWNNPPADLDNTTIYRSLPSAAYPNSWANKSSSQRMAELKRCEMATLMPKHHLLSGTRSLFAGTSTTSADYLAVWKAVRKSATHEPPLAFLSILGAQKILAPEGVFHALATQRFDAETALVGYENPGCFPRAWLVSHWQHLDTNMSSGRDELSKQVWFDRSGEFPNFREYAYVEGERAELPPTNEQRGDRPGTCQLVTSKPEQIVVRVSASEASLLVLCDQFCPGWDAWLWNEPRFAEPDGQVRLVQIYRANRIMRGVFVPPGEHLVEFRYRPRSVWVGSLVTGLTLIWMVIAFTRNTRLSRLFARSSKFA